MARQAREQRGSLQGLGLSGAGGVGFGGEGEVWICGVEAELGASPSPPQMLLVSQLISSRLKRAAQSCATAVYL